MSGIHEKGQYFTKNKLLKLCVNKLIKNNPKLILEPSVGRGDLVDYVRKKRKGMRFDMYEIDEEIEFLEDIEKEKINFGDFLNFKIDKKYKTIIGNPPYVKTSSGNLYIKFIEKCYDLLKDKGELIFIVPSDFIKLTSSGKIINKMLGTGTFTDIYHPNDERLFEKANIDVIVFRYCKDISLEKKVMLNGDEKYLINRNGIITFSDEKCLDMTGFLEYFEISVGMVTGKEGVFKNERYGNIEMLNGKNKKNKYILLNEFPSKDEELNKYMRENKDTLIKRKIRKFDENNWYEWGALRNYNKIRENMGKECLYVYNLSRSKEICFIDKVQYFGGSLIMMIPKKSIDLKKICEYMNSDKFKKNYMYSGRFKIGHKQLCNCLFNLPEFT